MPVAAKLLVPHEKKIGGIGREKARLDRSRRARQQGFRRRPLQRERADRRKARAEKKAALVRDAESAQR